MEAAGGGAVLNISSMSAENKNINMASYSSSKAAVSHLTRNIAFDLGPKGIRVNAIAPGATKTDALASVLTPEIEKTMLKHTPPGPIGRTQRHCLCRPVPVFPCGQLGEWADTDRQRWRRAGVGLGFSLIVGLLTHREAAPRLHPKSLSQAWERDFETSGSPAPILGVGAGGRGKTGIEEFANGIPERYAQSTSSS
jgi:hypothetical protein